jgi:hypothetical protein
VSATDADYDAISLLRSKNKNLLTAMGGANNDDEGRVILQPHEGKVLLTDVQVRRRAAAHGCATPYAHTRLCRRLLAVCLGAKPGAASPPTPQLPTPRRQITDSSEVVVKGRKPPFRLLVRAKRRGGGALSVLPAVSEGFVVATRRVKGETKADIPLTNEHVSKLSHVGKETCKKLANLAEAAAQAASQVRMPWGRPPACLPMHSAPSRPRTARPCPLRTLPVPTPGRSQSPLSSASTPLPTQVPPGKPNHLRPESVSALMAALTVNSVTTVAEFQALVRCMEDKGALQSTVRGLGGGGLLRLGGTGRLAGGQEGGGRAWRGLRAPTPTTPQPTPPHPSARARGPTLKRSPPPPPRQLINVLKLNKEKWEEARDHALAAVLPDRRMRAWYEDTR